MASCKTWALGNRRGSEIQKRRRKKERRKEEKWATWREVRLGVGVSEEKRSLRRVKTPVVVISCSLVFQFFRLAVVGGY